MNENVAAPKTVIYKGVQIDRDDYIYPYSFNFYVIHAAGIRAGTFKGWDWYSNTECRAQTIEEARAEVDRHLAIAGIEAVAPPPSGRAAVEHTDDPTFAGGVQFLRTLDYDRAHALYATLSDPAGAVGRSIEDGVQWTRWRLRRWGGMLGFIHLRGLFPDWSDLDTGDTDIAIFFVDGPRTTAVETAFDKSTVRPAWVIYRDGTDKKIS